MKKTTSIFALVLGFSMLYGAASPSFNRTKAITDKKVTNFNNVTSVELARRMLTGWNLGNTLDAIHSKTLSSETCWGQPRTTKAMIDGLKKAGIKTIRIPVSWSNHIIDNSYTIDPEWMNRVKEIVDWAISDDLYVILNCHHDNYENNKKIPARSGYYPTLENFEESERFMVNIWSQITLAFNNGYDEHLIFEVLNEPRLRGTNIEWWNDTNSSLYKEASDCLNKFNQTCLDTIRNSGGNNEKRCVMIPGLQASVGSVLLPEFKMPKDKSPNKLMVSVHMYSPTIFAIDAPGTAVFTNQHKQELAGTFKTLAEKYINNGYGVVIGEYGATNKDNLKDRIAWFEYFTTYSQRWGIPAVLWDNGSAKPSKNESERFGFYNRTNQTWYFPEILEAIKKGVATGKSLQN